MFRDHFDAVVMLTFGEWGKDRGNRLHFGTRFARHLPVYFVQPDRLNPGAPFSFEDTEVQGLTLIHVHNDYQTNPSSVFRALRARGVLKPLLWIYNPFFLPFVREVYAGLKVYHATEDYYLKGSYSSGKVSYGITNTLTLLFKHVDLVVSITDAILGNCRRYGRYAGSGVVSPNGCVIACQSV